MGFSIRWDNEAKTVFRYIGEGQWNWNDFHKYLKLAEYQFEVRPRPVEAILDLSGTPHLPAGAVAHLRSVGKGEHPKRTPRLVIIGVDEATQQRLGAINGVYERPGQLLKFVPDEAAAQEAIAEWLAESSDEDNSSPGA